MVKQYSNYIQSLDQLARIYLKHENYEQSLKYFNRLLNEIKKLNKIENNNSNEITTISKNEIDQLLYKSWIYNSIGTIFLKKKDYSNSLEYRKKALKIRQEINSIENIAESYNDIGVIYHLMHQYKEAIVLYKKSLEYFIDDENKGIIYNNLGASFYHLKKFYESEIAYKKSYEIFKNLPDALQLAEISYNRSVISHCLENKTEALQLSKIGLKWCEFIKNDTYISLTQKLIGDLYLYYNNFNEAKKYYKHCLKYYEKNDKIMYTQLIKLIKHYSNN